MRQVIAFMLITLLLSACESDPPAPVIERAPTKPAPPITKSVKPTPVGKDWRPDSYIVKKGDTLFSIALQFGYDYKDIAAANNIVDPYPIKIGQKLNFTSLNAKTEVKPNTAETEGGVVVSPIKSDGTSVSATQNPSSAVTPELSEPKAVREPYSIDAWNRKAVIVKPADAKPADTKPADIKPTDSKPETKPADEENISWVWPAQGKIVGNFVEGSNKGIDIAGTSGQAVNAAAPGKVIYTGSDLRGYGKLVIIKHNKIYLSVYAHNSKILAREGQFVVSGQKIAEMGNTDAGTTQLHFEIRQQGKSVDPAKFLPQN